MAGDRYEVIHGPVAPNLICGPYAVLVVKHAHDGKRLVSSVSGIQSAARCDAVALDYAANFKAAIKNPLLVPMKVAA